MTDLKSGEVNVISFGKTRDGENEIKLKERLSEVRVLKREDLEAVAINQEDLPELISEGLNLARQAINELRVRHGLDSRLDSELGVYFLSSPVFENYTDDWSGGSEGSVVVGNAVVLRNPERPNYTQVSAGFHELVHCDLETVTVGVSGDDVTRGRFGMLIDRKRVKNGEELWFNQGNLLNEMPVHARQHEFEERLLDLPKFADERESRLIALDKLGGETYFFRRALGATVGVYICKNFMPEVISGEIRENSARGLILQMVEDIGVLVKQKSGDDFVTMVEDAKLVPLAINKLAKGVDAALGQGFFSRLRSMNFSIDNLQEVSVLAAEIQSKRLEEDPEAYGHN